MKNPKEEFIRIDAELELMPSGVVKFDKRRKAHPIEVSLEEFEKHLKKMKGLIKDNTIGDIND